MSTTRYANAIQGNDAYSAIQAVQTRLLKLNVETPIVNPITRRPDYEGLVYNVREPASFEAVAARLTQFANDFRDLTSIPLEKVAVENPYSNLGSIIQITQVFNQLNRNKFEQALMNLSLWVINRHDNAELVANARKTHNGAYYVAHLSGLGIPLDNLIDESGHMMYEEMQGVCLDAMTQKLEQIESGAVPIEMYRNGLVNPPPQKGDGKKHIPTLIILEVFVPLMIRMFHVATAICSYVSNYYQVAQQRPLTARVVREYGDKYQMIIAGLEDAYIRGNKRVHALLPGIPFVENFEDLLETLVVSCIASRCTPSHALYFALTDKRINDNSSGESARLSGYPHLISVLGYKCHMFYPNTMPGARKTMVELIGSRHEAANRDLVNRLEEIHFSVVSVHTTTVGDDEEDQASASTTHDKHIGIFSYFAAVLINCDENDPTISESVFDPPYVYRPIQYESKEDREYSSPHDKYNARHRVVEEQSFPPLPAYTSQPSTPTRTQVTFNPNASQPSTPPQVQRAVARPVRTRAPPQLRTHAQVIQQPLQVQEPPALTPQRPPVQREVNPLEIVVSNQQQEHQKLLSETMVHIRENLASANRLNKMQADEITRLTKEKDQLARKLRQADVTISDLKARMHEREREPESQLSSQSYVSRDMAPEPASAASSQTYQYSSYQPPLIQPSYGQAYSAYGGMQIPPPVPGNY